MRLPLIRRHSHQPVEGVSNIELFYDLIFVYCISVLTALCHHVDGFLDLGTWLIFTFSYLAILQVWFFTTLLMNRFGERSAADCAFLFVNMFLLYFMAGGVQAHWDATRVTFNASWALILLNQALAWWLKGRTFDNLDADDLRMIRLTTATLVAQAAIALAAAVLPLTPSICASWAAMLLGGTVWGRARSYKAKAARFAHVAERCSLLVIVAFGETVVALSGYLTQTSRIVYPILVFSLVVGLFLIYIFEHDNMLDHHAQTDGMAYMTLTAWLVVVMGNLTVALEYMPEPEVSFLPKSVYIAVSLVLYLLTSFAIQQFNKPEFTVSGAYRAGRVACCAAIAIVAVATGFDPLVTLVADTLAVWAALAHEVFLFRRRSGLVAFGRFLGMGGGHARAGLQHDRERAADSRRSRKPARARHAAEPRRTRCKAMPATRSSMAARTMGVAS